MLLNEQIYAVKTLTAANLLINCENLSLKRQKKNPCVPFVFQANLYTGSESSRKHETDFFTSYEP